MLKLFALLCVLAAPAHAAMCGDCDGDGRVTIAELVRAVSNSLNDCGLWCDSLHDEACYELPSVVVDGVQYVCDVSVRNDSCLVQLVRETGFCHQVSP